MYIFFPPDEPFLVLGYPAQQNFNGRTLPSGYNPLFCLSCTGSSSYNSRLYRVPEYQERFIGREENVHSLSELVSTR